MVVGDKWDEQQANHYIGKALQLSLNSEQLLFPGQGESLETQDVEPDPESVEATEDPITPELRCWTEELR